MIFGKKPRMMEKFKKHYDRHKSNKLVAGQDKEFAPWGFTLNYDNKCNFKCQHCFTRSALGDFGMPTLTLEDVKSLADQADALDCFEVDIQGGEPLMNKDLFKILEAVDTSRFYTYLTSNGWFMTEELAHKLASVGVDRIVFSIDSFIPEEHDEFRGKKGAYNRAIQAAEYTKNAGMRAYFAMTIGNYNAQSQELEKFVDFAASKHYGVIFNCASPSGAWKGHYDMMMSETDTKKIESLRANNPEIIRDLWNILDSNDLIVGCPAINFFYVNPYGDVLPCVFMHTSMGNIKEKPLKDILMHGFEFEQINKVSPKCLTGENIDFAKKYLNQETSVMQPMIIDEFFKA